MLYMKLQQKLPASMLVNYHRWLFENRKIECVAVLCEYVVQEAEFHTRALETVQGLSARRYGKFDTRVMKESPQTFFGRPSLSQKLEVSKGLVRSVISHMVYGPVKNLKG